MDRVKFLQSIQTENKSDIFVRYFDQLMGLYGLVSNSDFRISAYPTTDYRELLLHVEVSDQSKLSETHQAILSTGNVITIYEHTFQIRITGLTDSSIDICIGL